MILDATTCVLTGADTKVRLRPSGAALIECLARAYPRHATHNALMAALWPDDNEPETSDKGLSVQIHSTRRLIERVGLQIGSVWGKGYILSQPVALADGAPVAIPPRYWRQIVGLLESHPDRAAADTLLAKVGA